MKGIFNKALVCAILISSCSQSFAMARTVTNWATAAAGSIGGYVKKHPGVIGTGLFVFGINMFNIGLYKMQKNKCISLINDLIEHIEQYDDTNVDAKEKAEINSLKKFKVIEVTAKAVTAAQHALGADVVRSNKNITTERALTMIQYFCFLYGSNQKKEVKAINIIIDEIKNLYGCSANNEAVNNALPPLLETIADKKQFIVQNLLTLKQRIQNNKEGAHMFKFSLKLGAACALLAAGASALYSWFTK